MIKNRFAMWLLGGMASMAIAVLPVSISAASPELVLDSATCFDCTTKVNVCCGDGCDPTENTCTCGNPWCNCGGDDQEEIQ
jgi:hypothetical protein